MTNRIMLRAHADENTIQFRTISARMKSPQRFYITYDELDRLRRDGSIITNDTLTHWMPGDRPIFYPYNDNFEAVTCGHV